MSVSYTPSQAQPRTLSNIELWAAPLVQHYSVLSAGPGLGYGTQIHYALCTMHYALCTKYSNYALCNTYHKQKYKLTSQPIDSTWQDSV